MPLCFWAAQTAAAALDLCDRIGRSDIKPYLPPHTAATVIQRGYRSHLDDTEFDWQIQLLTSQLELEQNMDLAMRELDDDDSWFCRLDNG